MYVPTLLVVNIPFWQNHIISIIIINVQHSTWYIWNRNHILSGKYDYSRIFLTVYLYPTSRQLCFSLVMVIVNSSWISTMRQTQTFVSHLNYPWKVFVIIIILINPILKGLGHREVKVLTMITKLVSGRDWLQNLRITI